jgi:hypothetical protein
MEFNQDNCHCHYKVEALYQLTLKFQWTAVGDWPQLFWYFCYRLPNSEDSGLKITDEENLEQLPNLRLVTAVTAAAGSTISPRLTSTTVAKRWIFRAQLKPSEHRWANLCSDCNNARHQWKQHLSVTLYYWGSQYIRKYWCSCIQYICQHFFMWPLAFIMNFFVCISKF